MQRRQRRAEHQSLSSPAESVDGGDCHQAANVENLERRIADLENQISSADPKGLARDRPQFRDCNACEHMIQKCQGALFGNIRGRIASYLCQEMENHPYLRDLRDKFEKYHFKLVETKNENHLLKRELAMAKKVLCQELGIDTVDFKHIMSHAADDSLKGRREKVLILQQKNRELEQRIRELEGREPTGRPKTTPSEEQARQNVSEDRKAFWRMELEKRRGYQIGDKERSELAEENTELRRKLESSKSHNRELINEIRMLKGEIYAFSEKTRDDGVLEESLRSVEKQLGIALEERSDMRRELVGEKFRNKTLQEQIYLLTEQLEKYKEKGADDCALISGLSDQNKRLQCMLENEQVMSQQQMERHEEELKKMRANNANNFAMLQKLQAALQEKDAMVQKLNEQLDHIEEYLREKEAAEQAELAAREEQEEKEEGEGAEEGPKEAPEEMTEEEQRSRIEAEMQNMQMEMAKFKALYEAAKEEAENMADMISALNQKVDEINMQLLESQQMYLRNEMERKELQEKVCRLEKAVKGKKKKKKPWEKDARPSVSSLPPRSKAEHLAIKLDIMAEENDFLRSFLSTAIGTKEEDYRLFRTLADNTEKHFATNIEELRNEMLSQRKAESEAAETEGETDAAA